MSMETSLKTWMKAQRITDAALADKLGCSRPYLTRIKNGQATPSLHLMVKITEVTDEAVTARSLLSAERRAASR